MVQVLVLGFLALPLREARASGFRRLFLQLDLRRVALIDGRWLSPLSAKTQNVIGDMKTEENEARFGG
jgi:hypothetical protein